MRRFILDTGILVHYVRQSEVYKKIEKEQKLTESDCISMISVVTKGEILSFAIQNGWGASKIAQLQILLNKVITIDVNSLDNEMLTAYSEIDSYSKGKLPGQPKRSAHKMGKNDLWIAATAKTANATLLTVDNDFNHLNGVYFNVIVYKTK